MNNDTGNQRYYKTRNLPVLEYFEILQLEYIVTELRRKIYPKPKDRNYYAKLLNKKLTAIEDIANRNTLPSIFTDNDVKNQFYSKIYNEFGLPNFIYKDRAHEEEFKPLDLIHYYSKDADVKFKDKNGNIRIGIITNFDGKKNVSIKSNDIIEIYTIENVLRIL